MIYMTSIPLYLARFRLEARDHMRPPFDTNEKMFNQNLVVNRGKL